MKKLLVLLALLVVVVGCAATTTPRPTESGVALTRVDWLKKCYPHKSTFTSSSSKIPGLLRRVTSSSATEVILIKAEITKMEQAITALSRITPPERYQVAHSVLISGYRDYVLGVEYCMEGTQQSDASLVRLGTEYTLSSTEKLERFMRLTR